MYPMISGVGEVQQANDVLREVMEGLRKRNKHLPVILITAHDDAATSERVRRSGAAAYLRKPFDGQVLLDAIESAVRPEPGRTS